MAPHLYKTLFILLLLAGALPLKPQQLELNSSDTLKVNPWLRKGQQFHGNRPDSALYYYQKVYDHKNLGFIVKQGELTDLEKAYIETVIESLNQTGNIFYYNDEYSRSQYYYEKSLELAKSAQMPEHMARAYFDLGYVRYVNNEYARAKDLFEASYAQYSALNDQGGMFYAMHACGLTDRRLGNFIDADSCFSKALRAAVMLEDSMMISDVKLNWGILLCEQGNLEEGISLFEEALDHYESLGDAKAISLALLNIGVVMKMVNEYDKALSYILRSTEMEEANQQKYQLAIRYYNLADLYLDMGKPENAYGYCQKLLAVANEIGSRPFLTECNFLLGKYHYMEKDYPRAGSYLNLAADSVASTNNKPLATNIHLWLARTHLKLGHDPLAAWYAQRAFDYAREMNSLPWQKEASELLSQSYDRSNNYKEALRWQKTFTTLSDSISYFNQQKEINRIETRYNFEKKEKENELLRNKASLQEQKLRNRTIVTITLFVIISFSILTILLLIRRNRDAKLLYEQQQMLNLQHLHEIENELDGKKRELASKMMFLNQKNELIGRIIKRLQEMQDSSHDSTEELNDIVSELRVEAPQSNWKEFEMQFNQVHPDFYRRLYDKHPDLTSYEQRICAFLRMNLNSKEISAITGRSLKSIEVTRSRIRTKLNLSRNDNLNSFLASV